YRLANRAPDASITAYAYPCDRSGTVFQSYGETKPLDVVEIFLAKLEARAHACCRLDRLCDCGGGIRLLTRSFSEESMDAVPDEPHLPAIKVVLQGSGKLSPN